MRKVLALIPALILVFSLAACGGSAGDEDKDPGTDAGTGTDAVQEQRRHWHRRRRCRHSW